MRVIVFESVGCISITMIGGEVIGKQVGELTDGLLTMYGATSEDMGFESFIMTAQFNLN